MIPFSPCINEALYYMLDVTTARLEGRALSSNKRQAEVEASNSLGFPGSPLSTGRVPD